MTTQEARNVLERVGIEREHTHVMTCNELLDMVEPIKRADENGRYAKLTPAELAKVKRAIIVEQQSYHR